MLAADSVVSARDRASEHAEILIGVMVFCIASGSILLTPLPDSLTESYLWPANAMAAATLHRHPRVRRVRAAIWIGMALWVASTLIARAPLYACLGFTLINLGEIALMLLALHFVCRFPYPEISGEQAAIMTSVVGVVIPGICAVAGATFQILVHATPFEVGALQWWSAHAAGACLFGTPVLLFSRAGFERLVSRRSAGQSILILALSAAVICVAIGYASLPFVSIAFALLVAAFRLGGLGTSLLASSAALTIIALWTRGARPLGVDIATAPGSITGFPMLVLLLTVMPPVAVGLSVSARDKMLRALEESERHFRAALDHSPIGIVVAELNGIWSYTNLALQRMLGYTAEEFRAFPPGGPAVMSEWVASKTRWNELLTGKTESYDVERRFRHKDGRWLWTHVAVSMMRDAEGRPWRLIAQIESLEARRRAEMKLAQEHTRLLVTLRSISDAVITTGVGGQITYINTAAESLLGQTLSGVVNRPVEDILNLKDPDTAVVAANLIAQSQALGRTLRRQSPCELHRPDGTLCYVSDVVSPVVDETGCSLGLVIVLRDASEEVARERELRRSALQDPLTGLATRADFQRQLREAHRRARYQNHPAALLAIDLDRFKALNDLAGHAAGDALLRKVADGLRAAVRIADIVARLGGDEFAVVLLDCTPERAVAIGQHLLRALNPLSLDWEGTHYDTGASIGLAARPQDFASEQDWLVAADKA